MSCSRTTDNGNLIWRVSSLDVLWVQKNFPADFLTKNSRLSACLLNHSTTKALIFVRPQSLKPTSFISEREQLRSIKNEELNCEKFTQEVEEYSRTKAEKRRANLMNKNTHFPKIALNFVREQLTKNTDKIQEIARILLQQIV